MTTNKNKSNPPIWTKFAVSGLGGATGWLFVHPFDVTKTRLQVTSSSGGTLLSTLKTMIKEEGILSLYSGLSAGITRQLTYTTLRLGLYDVLRSSFTVENEELSLYKKLLIGLTAGGTAAAICNPVEVALVRLQADGAQTDLKLRRNYKHVFDAFYRVAKEEGFITLYRGVRPTVARGMIVSMVQLASYDHCKHLYKKFLKLNDGPLLHLFAAVSSGYLYSLASLPLDIAKVRMQNQLRLPNGELLYKTIPGAISYIVKNEGLLSLWKGFLPYFARSGGHTVCMFLCVEQYRRLVKWMY